MKLRTLGSQGLTVSELGLGCMGMSEFYGHTNDNESIQTIHRAVDLGVTLFDTADMYGPFINEELVGKALKPYRDKVTIATKFGVVRTADPQKRGINGKPEYVKQSCDASLKRLGVDYIDLYYQHRVDTTVPIEETFGAIKDLVTAGKIRYAGISEASPATIRRAHAVQPLSALQTEYSLWSRDPEDEIIFTLQELGIGFVAYSPLGRGFLTGQIKKFDDLEQNDFRRFSPRFQGENFEKNLDLVAHVERIAKEKRCTPAQLALAWVLAQNRMIVPIPGTKSEKRLEENVGAVNITFTSDELKKIQNIFPKGAAVGNRYTEAAMKLLNQ
jgi:aryl-alcohol dehydrogenase-like predicted oxidoreductase